ncbi:MAG: CHAT domain-containing protein [Bacteroidetes bacterium]|nr:CHAT domain-containing protein [Bacteroidota bacterium]
MDDREYTWLNEGFQRAETVWREGKHRIALDVYIDLLIRMVSEYGGGPLLQRMEAAHLVVIDRCADLAFLFGYGGPSDDLLMCYASLTADAGNISAASYATLKRTQYALAEGRIEHAEQLLRSMCDQVGTVEWGAATQQTLMQWEATAFPSIKDTGHRTLLLSRLLLCTGRLQMCRGNFAAAIAILSRGLAYTGVNVPDIAHRAEIPMRLFIAQSHLECGELGIAENQLVELMPAVQDGSRDPGAWVRCVELRAKIRMLQGEYGEGMRLHREALDHCSAAGFEHAVNQAMLTRAYMRILLNQAFEAREELSELEHRAENMGDGASAAHARILMNLARKRVSSSVQGVSVYRAWQGKHTFTGAAGDSGNEVENDTNLPAIHRSPSFLSLFEQHVLHVHQLVDGGGVAGARQYVDTMHEMFGESDSRLIAAHLVMLDGICRYISVSTLPPSDRSLMFVEPTHLFNDAAVEFERMGIKPMVWEATRLRAECMLRMEHDEAGYRDIMREADVLVHELAESLPPEDRAIYMVNKWTDEEKQLALAIDKLMQLHADRGCAPWFKRPMLRWKEMRAIHEVMCRIEGHRPRVVHDRTGSEAVAHQTSFARRLMGCSPRRTVVAFLVLPDRVFVVLSGWMQLRFGVNPVTRSQIREAVRQWHRLIHDDVKQRTRAFHFDRRRGEDSHPRRNTDQERDTLALELAQALQLDHIVERFPRWVVRLTILPDDCLHGFPFAAMRIGSCYLCERCAVSIAFEPYRGREVREWRALRHTRRKALVVGVSPAFDPLEGIDGELIVVKAAFAANRLHVESLENQSADKERVLEELARCSVAHLACHGRFRPDALGDTGLVLLSKDGGPVILSCLDLAARRFPELQHITLTACWSADSYVHPSRIIVSLADTFWRCGASSILGSLWPAADAPAHAIVERFYRYLRRYPCDLALQRVQRECFSGDLNRQSGMDCTNPFYWAGYQMYGSPRRLRPFRRGLISRNSKPLSV